MKNQHPGKYPDNGFATKEEAAEYGSKFKAWWGSNLVLLAPEQKEGRWFPQWNVWD